MAENIELQSGVLKLLQNARVGLLLCVQVEHTWGLSDSTQSNFWLEETEVLWVQLDLAFHCTTHCTKNAPGCYGNVTEQVPAFKTQKYKLSLLLMILILVTFRSFFWPFSLKFCHVTVGKIWMEIIKWVLVLNRTEPSLMLLVPPVLFVQVNVSAVKKKPVYAITWLYSDNSVMFHLKVCHGIHV